jgi:hypothetical protein
MHVDDLEQRNFAGWPLRLSHSPQKGRYVVAKRNIEKGMVSFYNANIAECVALVAY